MTLSVFHQVLIHSFLSLLLGSFNVFQQNTSSAPPEICENAIDDDGDGLTDLNDPDCECEVIELMSLIPNPSFEDMTCCPSMESQLNCADVWIQASEPTTDFIHMCGWLGWAEFRPPLPFPHGEGIMGFRDGRVRQNDGTAEPFWKEYAGACLLAPLIKDSSYVFEFYVGFVNRAKSPDINITFFGTSDCDNLPFGVGDEAFGCPTNSTSWVRLGSSFVTSVNNKWVKTTIEVTPQQHITGIAIGPDCPAVASPISIYYFFDNLTLVDLRSYQFQITAPLHPCSDDFYLKVEDLPGFTYQWYKEGIALVGETSAAMSKIYGEGNYQVRISDANACRVSGTYNYSIPFLTKQVKEIICTGDTYPFGDLQLTEAGTYVETFKSINNCDSIVSLELSVAGHSSDTTYAKIFQGEVYKIGNQTFDKTGNYNVTLVTKLGCDSLVLLQLEYYDIYIPNVFTPNHDGINDLFTVSAAEELMEIDMRIFDRWGNQIFQGSEWDGSSKDLLANPGVYTYIVRITTFTGSETQFSGSVTLLK